MMTKETYTLVLTKDDIQVIANALGELPLKVVQQAFIKISEQVSQQEKEATQ